MNMRSASAQAAQEELDEDRFAARLGPAEAAFYSMTMAETRDLIGCKLHEVEPGTACGEGHGLGPFVCIGRRIDAAFAKPLQ